MRARVLDFGAVDRLGFAGAAGQLAPMRSPRRYEPLDLGPLIELYLLAASEKVPDPVNADWLVHGESTALMRAIDEGRNHWVRSSDGCAGLLRTSCGEPNSCEHLTSFLMAAQRAARNVARLSPNTSGQLAAAMSELESNIREHSCAVDTGVVAFRARPGVFEFVVADRGVGVLSSLRSNAEYAALEDHGRALELALTDGVSRFGATTQRGHGFRQIFVGLANLYGYLRFRSGDHALVIDGTDPGLAMAQLAQKVDMDGLVASVRCGIPGI